MEFNATFIVSAISFIVFSIIMNAIFYKPLAKIVQERKDFIDETNKNAKSNQEKSQAILRNKERKLEQTKHDAKKIILDKSNEVKAQKDSMTSDAHQKANQTIESAKQDLNKSKNKAQEALSDNVINLAQDISSKILGENISIKNTDKDLINTMMSEGK